MVSLPDTFAAFKLQKRLNAGDYPNNFHCEGYELDDLKWLQLHGKPQMLTFLFIHVIIENDHHSEFTKEAVLRLCKAFERNGLLHEDIEMLGRVQSRRHLDIEFKLKARTPALEESITKSLKTGRMLKETRGGCCMLNCILHTVPTPALTLHLSQRIWCLLGLQ
jgi:hypothetical protein